MNNRIDSVAQRRSGTLNTVMDGVLDRIDVTIIIPCFNSGALLLDSVNSVINQTFENWRLFVIDDCSTDPQTKEVLRQLPMMDERIEVLSTSSNSGAGVARNVGLDHVTSQYVAFCDADDWWYPEKLEKQIRYMLDNEYRFVCSYYEDCDADLNVKSVVRQKGRQCYSDLISGCNIGSPGVVYCKTGVEDIRFPSARRGEDWRMWLRLLTRIDYLYSYPEPLWKYRHTLGSTNSKKKEIVPAVIRLYKEELHFSTVRSYLTFAFVFLPRYVWRKLIK